MTKLHMTIRPPRAPGPGVAPRALLVHGTMDRSTSFTRIAQRLPEWTIVTYDRRGYAGSSAAAPSTHFGDQINDLFEVLDASPGDGRGVVAFGHSLGGDVVLGAVAQRPELFDGAVVYEAPASWEPWWPGGRPDSSWDQRDPGDLAEGFMRQVIGDHIWERLPVATRLQRRAEGQTMLAEIKALAAERPFDPGAITVPVLVARGALADQRHVRSADVLAAAIPGAELVVVDEADHGAHLSHPTELAELLRRCLARAEELSS